mgnify:CR=1 FL=1
MVSFGPEHGALEQRQVEHALNEAESLRPSPKFVVFCAFTFDPEAAKDIDETRWPGVNLLKAQMNTDLLTEDLKKARSSNQSFWLMGQPDVHLAELPDGRIYPRRQVFGAYVAAQLQSASASGLAAVRHLQDSAAAIARHGPEWRVTTTGGRVVAADLVVLAVSHPPPAVPPRLATAFGEAPGFVPDPWAARALDRIDRLDDVVVMGTALSMADIVASLDRRGHRGRIVAFSRRGRRSQPQAPGAHAPFGDFAASPPTTNTSSSSSTVAPRPSPCPARRSPSSSAASATSPSRSPTAPWSSAITATSTAPSPTSTPPPSPTPNVSSPDARPGSSARDGTPPRPGVLLAVTQQGA